MTKPTKPTVPPAPLRSQPDTFSARAETFLAFWPDFATYLDDVGTFTDEQADNALAAALGGDLPPLTGKALQYLRVNAGATAAEFHNVLDSPALTGTPTIDARAIFERGSNANGEYVKYADGTMICWHSFTTTTSSTTTPWSFPAAFISTSSLSVTGSSATASTSVRLFSSGSQTVTGVQVQVVDGSGSRINTASLSALAIGRWF